MKALDLEAVQAFVLVADFKSFTRAAEAMNTTQSAVSLKIKRLEEGIGRRLLERTPRLVRLSAEGNAFLGAARTLLSAHQSALGAFAVHPRRLVVGISHHVVGGELPLLLKRMKSAEPELVIEMRVASSRETIEAFDQGMLDAAIVLGQDNRRLDGDIILEEGFGWMGVPDFEYYPGQPLRLATQAEPCSVRGMAVAALAGGGIAWTEVFVGGGIATIGAAISAGLAVAALGRRVAPAGTIDLGPQLGLPPLPSRDIVLHSNVSDPRTRSSLRLLVTAIRSTQ
ncbi:bacterial regulatory helix-turn-helix, lysR family protein [Collimonas arenae]|uniref:Bacterial regulatory helix-turn-helix, lysR family protein n=1 Tax=Collimonas arenae TaxID=279058 RepID=A0A127QJJ2_9BURK|nr:LysR family transcriptional regulator [Collimonas arenae]AMP09955.1 bacterial regulatory helix-turn-helix, lysR family protein [Collimonas arenae]